MLLSRYLSLGVDQGFISPPRRYIWCTSIPLLLLACWAAEAAVLCANEPERARVTSQRIEEEWPLYAVTDPVTVYVQGLVASLAALHARAESVPWKVRVVRELLSNAFAIGNGQIYITEGAVSLSANESELAAILAHEMGHQISGHFCHSPPESGRNGFWDLFGSNRSTAPDSRGTALGSISRVDDPRKEIEADKAAIQILAVAGYDPTVMLTVARRLSLQPAQTHQGTEWRIRVLEKEVSGRLRQPVHDSDAFREVLKQLH